MAVSFISGGNRSTGRKQPTWRKSLPIFSHNVASSTHRHELYHYMIYHTIEIQHYNTPILSVSHSIIILYNKGIRIYFDHERTRRRLLQNRVVHTELDTCICCCTINSLEYCSSSTQCFDTGIALLVSFLNNDLPPGL